MRLNIPAAILLPPAAVAVPVAQQQTELDYATIAQIRDEGLNRSQVMDHISWLSDVYGPRLTGGPGIMQASDWAMKKLTGWGLVNAHRETWAFGKGWSLVRFSAHMIEPQVQPLIGFPGSRTAGPNLDDAATPTGFHSRAETPGTDPALKDEVVILGAPFDSVAAATGAA